MLFEHVFSSLIEVLSWQSVAAMVGGTVIGLLISALPGLSPTMAIALAIPFTYGMHPITALGLLAGIHNGSSQGGAIPAVLLDVPGTPGSVCTAWDGYPMARAGHAGAAIQLAAVSSAVGGMLGALSLAFLAPPLASVAIAFGPPEIFWVNVFGLSSIAALLGGDVLKGLAASCFGLLVGTIGLDNVTGHERFTFEIPELVNGISELAVMIGLFSLPPIWELATSTNFPNVPNQFDIKSSRGVWSVAGVWRAWIKSSIIGIIIGILPGSAIGAFIAYSEAKRSSKEPEKFGKGSPEGLAAAESVNNADNAAAMIPALTLGVPGSSIAALMLGALLIHGFQPGPQLFRNSPEIVFGYTWQMFITSAMLIFFGGALASRIFSNILRVPRSLLLPVIICIAVAGTFASESLMFDVYVMVIFGTIGLGMKYFGFPIAPVVIGLVLGASAEFQLRVSLMISGGDPSILFTRPICIIMMVLTALMLLYPAMPTLRALFGAYFARSGKSA